MIAEVTRDDATEIDPRQIGGLKRLRHLLPLLQPLHDAGCQRDRAGNRQLHFDEYVTLVLLYLFNPLIDSVRGLQQAAAVEKVSAQLGVKRFSLGSFSESCRVFDPQKLKAIVEQLSAELNPVGHDPRLMDLKQILTAVDGTVLDAISSVAAAWWLPFVDGSSKYAWRLHTHYDVEHGVPSDLQLTDARCSGKSDEKNVLRSKLQKDHCYILDRWYAQFALFNVIHAKEHEKRGGRKGKNAGAGNGGTIVIATNLLEVPAEIIALIYLYRYTIEIFFRFRKQILGCRHLISSKPEGIMIQMYCAVIACLLINLWTGAKPTKRTVEMLAFYFMGVASEAEMLRHIAGLKKTNA